VRKIPTVVLLLGLVSFFNDISSEMLFPIMPIFLTQVLGAPVFVVGIIEGVAEGIASFSKMLFGYVSDKLQKRKPFVVTGYASSSIAKIIIAFSNTWQLFFIGRSIDRLGKGVRTAARDAFLLEASGNENKGFIFGFHRAMDSAGAVVGPTIALLVLYIFHNNLRLVLYAAIIPAFLSLPFFFFVKELRKHIQTTAVKLSLSLQRFPKQLRLFLLGITIFSLGNSSDTFLILRAKNLGLSLILVISAYIVYNFVYAISSTPAGSISDKIGTKRVFLTGILLFTFVYLGFALNTNPLVIWPLFAIYGFYIALTDGISKALVGASIAKEEAGTIYGTIYTITSIVTLLASLIGGILWSAINPSATFLFGALCAALSFGIFTQFKENS